MLPQTPNKNEHGDIEAAWTKQELEQIVHDYIGRCTLNARVNRTMGANVLFITLYDPMGNNLLDAVVSIYRDLE